ncbi:MAG: hypothetical protein ABFR02_01350 [Campylobacterota bacterium]
MKHLFILIFFTTSLFSFYLSDRLPKEAVQLVDSFDCFSKDDKTVMYTYLLALKYRMEHVNDRDALVKSDLDYWRLWHLVSDIEHDCSLYYKFSYILEETITSSPEDKTTLKKLRRVEGRIRTDGSSESSARMSKYDAGLRKKLLQDPPKFKVSAKNQLLNDYNLTSIKHYPKLSIPQNIYDAIKKQNISGKKEDILFRYAFLKEEMLRNYDQPKKRHEIKQELLYIQECQKYHKIYLKGEFYHNFKRKLANRSSQYSNYYPIKNEFLPKEVEAYCEHNITKTEVTTFYPKQEKKIPKVKKIIKLENLKAFLEQYNDDATKKKYAEQYFNLMKEQLEKSSTPTPSLESLKLIRLKNCLVAGDDKEDFKLIMSRVKDFRLEGIKEIFYSNIFNSQMWWMTTIRMKIDQEGESEELKHFFDCNQTSVTTRPAALIQTKTSNSKDKSRFSASNMRNASFQRDEIFKYYAGTFENKPTPEMNNEKAIKAGLLSKKMLDAYGKIKVPFGDKIVIKGMPKGGLSLTYYGIPKGKLCSDFIMFGKTGNETIFYNSKAYDGLDYILLNGHKIKVKHYVRKHVERLCSKEDNNIISFVKEQTITKKEYKGSRKLDSAFGNVKKINYEYSLDDKIKMYVKKLPRKYKHSHNKILSPSGKYLAIGYQGKEICIWDVIENQFVKIIKISYKEFGGLDTFLSDNKTIMLVGKKIHFLDTDTNKISGEIEPRFTKSKKSFSRPRITSWIESPDGSTLYIAGNKNTIERWNIKKSKLGSREISYIDQIEDKEVKEVGVLVFDPRDRNILIIGSTFNKIKFLDIKHKKVVKTLIADKQMSCKNITLSDDHKYILAVGWGAFLWRLEDGEQLDIISGNRISKGVFLPNSSNFATIGEEVSVWEIKK